MSKSFSIRLSTEETMALVVVLVDRLADVKSTNLVKYWLMCRWG